jgi:hypothetical protein
MKINTSDEFTIERNGLASNGSFSIDFNSKMAAILSDGVYSNKIQAIIRELSCNAIDSHVDAGCGDKSIEVHLPTVFEPWFYVRDFGVGLDHEQVVGTYTVYGASTKINSNEFIGQLGLGSKAPFSYVNAFDVVARKNGIERHYSMFKNEKNMPDWALLAEKPTSESNGVTVKMPVKTEDIRRFSAEAQSVFRWFDTKPVITGVNELVIPTIEYVYSGKNWGIRKYDGYGSDVRPLAVMGRVAYPLDSRSLDNLSTAETAVLGMPVVLDFNIGDLEVVASREGLGYDARTQQNIQCAIQNLIQELGNNFAKQIADAASEWQARSLWGKIFTNNNHYKNSLERVFGDTGIKWQGLLIREPHVTLKTQELWDDNFSHPKLWRSHHRYKTVQQDIGHKNLSIRCDSDPLIIFNDLERGAISRASWAFLSNNQKREVYMIGHSDLKTREQILNMLGNPPYVLASKLPSKPVNRSKRVNMLEWSGSWGKMPSERWKTVDCDLETGGIYVIMDRFNVMWNNRQINDLTLYINWARELGIISSDRKIHSPRAEMRKKVTQNENWINLFDLIQQEVSNRLTIHVRQSIADNQEYKRVLDVNRDTSLWKYPLRIANSNGVFARFVQNMLRIEAINAANKNLNLLVEVAWNFGVTVDLPAPSINVYADIQQVFSVYPMLALAMSKYSTQNINASTASTFEHYINIVDANNEQILQHSAENLVAA